ARARGLERAAEHSHWEDGLLRGDEPEPHGFSFAKKAVAFLRNSPIRRGACDERESQSPRAAMEVLDHALPVALFIVRGTRVDVGHAKAECLVEEDCELPRGGSYRLRLSGAGGEAAIEGAERCLCLAHVDRRDSQQRG